MGFDVADQQPAAPNYLNPPNAIRATTIDSILQLDRYCFATRRNLIASICDVKTGQASGIVMFRFQARTSPASNGNVWVIAAGVNVQIVVGCPSSTVAMVLHGGTIADAKLLTGNAPDDWIEFTVEIGSDIAPAIGTLRGLYLVEEILSAADLP